MFSQAKGKALLPRDSEVTCEKSAGFRRACTAQGTAGILLSTGVPQRGSGGPGQCGLDGGTACTPRTEEPPVAGWSPCPRGCPHPLPVLLTRAAEQWGDVTVTVSARASSVGQRVGARRLRLERGSSRGRPSPPAAPRPAPGPPPACSAVPARPLPPGCSPYPSHCLRAPLTSPRHPGCGADPATYLYLP